MQVDHILMVFSCFTHCWIFFTLNFVCNLTNKGNLKKNPFVNPISLSNMMMNMIILVSLFWKILLLVNWSLERQYYYWGKNTVGILYFDLKILFGCQFYWKLTGNGVTKSKKIRGLKPDRTNLNSLMTDQFTCKWNFVFRCFFFF